MSNEELDGLSEVIVLLENSLQDTELAYETRQEWNRQLTDLMKIRTEIDKNAIQHQCNCETYEVRKTENELRSKEVKQEYVKIAADAGVKILTVLAVAYELKAVMQFEQTGTLGRTVLAFLPKLKI